MVARIFDFLAALKDNNQKTWFDEHRKQYEAARQDFIGIAQALLNGLKVLDPTLHDLEAKNCIFRINRDVRFSTDKSPYKLNFGASFQRGGKKTGFGGYYIHLQPGGESFVAGGVYMPMPDALAKIRQEIDYNFAEFRAIVENEAYRQTLGALWGEALKTPPKGYEKDNPAIEYLKMKSFTAFRQMTDDEVSQDGLTERVLAICQHIKPLNDFLNRAIMEV